MIILKVIASTLLTVFITTTILDGAAKSFRENVRASIGIAAIIFICLMTIAL